MSVHYTDFPLVRDRIVRVVQDVFGGCAKRGIYVSDYRGCVEQRFVQTAKLASGESIEGSWVISAKDNGLYTFIVSYIQKSFGTEGLLLKFDYNVATGVYTLNNSLQDLSPESALLISRLLKAFGSVMFRFGVMGRNPRAGVVLIAVGELLAAQAPYPKGIYSPKDDPSLRSFVPRTRSTDHEPA